MASYFHQVYKTNSPFFVLPKLPISNFHQVYKTNSSYFVLPKLPILSSILGDPPPQHPCISHHSPPSLSSSYPSALTALHHPPPSHSSSISFELTTTPYHLLLSPLYFGASLYTIYVPYVICSYLFLYFLIHITSLWFHLSSSLIWSIC